MLQDPPRAARVIRWRLPLDCLAVMSCLLAGAMAAPIRRSPLRAVPRRLSRATSLSMAALAQPMAPIPVRRDLGQVVALAVGTAEEEVRPRTYLTEVVRVAAPAPSRGLPGEAATMRRAATVSSWSSKRASDPDETIASRRPPRRSAPPVLDP